ncbi:hypothetical protein Pcinc_033508 [Petrolisthes cinctipes]|uniref:Uncharacterized protein n=1 Tax=Petrolisthes cinctipes TaxID=88211 RepID=A0AAE1JZ54_PETCI|nr:hypothetical protein Pcinc_033508 [Petrolisthes cinctipes]
MGLDVKIRFTSGLVKPASLDGNPSRHPTPSLLPPPDPTTGTGFNLTSLHSHPYFTQHTACISSYVSGEDDYPVLQCIRCLDLLLGPHVDGTMSHPFDHAGHDMRAMYVAKMAYDPSKMGYDPTKMGYDPSLASHDQPQDQHDEAGHVGTAPQTT